MWRVPLPLVSEGSTGGGEGGGNGVDVGGETGAEVTGTSTTSEYVTTKDGKMASNVVKDIPYYIRQFSSAHGQCLCRELILSKLYS